VVLPNAWDVASAHAIVAAGFPAVATTSAGVAASLGYPDHEAAPADEMLAAAARITRAVDAPVTVDAEAGYGMDPARLVDALRTADVAGCNLEDSDHAGGTLRDAADHAEWLRAVRQAAVDAGYPLVINARIDVLVGPFLSGAGPDAQDDLLPDAIARARAYLEAGVDCVYPIFLWRPEPLRRFTSAVDGPVNVLAVPPAPSVAELAALGVARVTWGSLLHTEAMARFGERLAAIPGHD
jgi:2-methylisocitrate lyase-like PEP mutase family enzyme